MSRRDFGTIVAKDQGKWLVRWSEGGRRKSKTVTGSKRDAQRFLAGIQAAATGDVSHMTLGTFWEHRYRPHVDRLAETTVLGYEHVWAASVRPRFGDVAMADVSRADVQDWLDGMSHGKASHALALMRAMYGYAEDLGLVDVNVMRKKYRLPRKDARMRAVNDMTHDRATLEAILTACEGQSWEAGYILSAFGGLRREEALGCRWESIEWADGFALVHVHEVCVSVNGRPVVKETKTAHSVRTVPIPAPYSTRLAAIRAQYPDDVWVSDDGFGSPLNPDTVAERWKRWHTLQPFPFVPWKNLRKSYGSVLHGEGIDLATIAKLLGHSGTQTTYSWYDRPSLEHLKTAVSHQLVTNEKREVSDTSR